MPQRETHESRKLISGPRARFFYVCHSSTSSCDTRTRALHLILSAPYFKEFALTLARLLAERGQLAAPVAEEKHQL